MQKYTAQYNAHPNSCHCYWPKPVLRRDYHGKR